MTPRAVLLWWTAALVLIAAAVTTTLARPQAITTLPEREPAFPALRAEPAAVAGITLANPTATLTLVALADGTWTLAERDGYPVEPEAVRRLVATLADMRLLEAKTARPERFARLGVEPITAAAARSTEIRLSTADGDTVAQAIFGDRVSRLGGFSEDGTYIRRAEDQRAWLASGSLDVSTEPADWLVRDIVDLRGDQVVRVRIEPAGDAAYEILRDNLESEFTLEPAPEDGTADTVAMGRLARIFAALRLEDVVPADDADDEPTSRVTVETADGLIVSAQLAERDDLPWLTLQADTAEGADEAAVSTAETLNARWQAWRFRLPAHVASRLTAPGDDLVVADEPAPQ